ncbi:hypothetical protein Btru_017163 [Bulinus truncatus]|nr:hypothetical protein Btru_017163 [Bulinus truncatus]
MIKFTMTSIAQQRFVFFGLALMSFIIAPTTAAPVSQPTIDNPCVLDPSAQIELYPIVDLLKAAITETNAAAASCQAYVDKVKSDRVLTDSEFSYFNADTTQLPGLPIRQPEVNVSRANDFIQKLRQIELNVTLLYTANEMLANTSVLPDVYLPYINVIARRMSVINCRLSDIIQVIKTNFTQRETNIDRELKLVDYTSFVAADRELADQTLSDIENLDIKSAILSENVIVGHTIKAMTTLVETLTSELNYRLSL